MTWRKYLAGSYVFLAAKKEELDVFPSYKYTRLADSNTDTKEKRKKIDLYVLQKQWRKNPCQKAVGGRGWRACGWIRWVLITNLC
jgi:hypothetical protein